MPELVATSEYPKVLKVMFDLEQIIGREIIWLRGMGWEEMINGYHCIPNRTKRICTTVLKMQSIFEFLFKYHDLPVSMRIGCFLIRVLVTVLIAVTLEVLFSKNF